MSITRYVHSDVIEAANLIDSLLDIIDPEEWLYEAPESGSPLDTISHLSSADRAEVISGFRAIGLVDQMRGLIGVMRSNSLYSGFTMARSVIEAASYVLWIWGENLSPEERVCRCLLEMRHDAIKRRDFWKGLEPIYLTSQPNSLVRRLCYVIGIGRSCFLVPQTPRPFSFPSDQGGILVGPCAD